jgi:hypothetical protein
VPVRFCDGHAFVSKKTKPSARNASLARRAGLPGLRHLSWQEKYAIMIYVVKQKRFIVFHVDHTIYINHRSAVLAALLSL